MDQDGQNGQDGQDGHNGLIMVDTLVKSYQFPFYKKIKMIALNNKNKIAVNCFHLNK
jgi:hypothetical protein